MTMTKYKNGYKSQLYQTREFDTPVYPEKLINDVFIKLNVAGHLTIRHGYAWDQSSGPTLNTRNQVTPSLVHDAFCQLIRQGDLPRSARKIADKYFYAMLRERGMNIIRARVWYLGVRWGAKHNNQLPKEILEAP